MYRVCPYELDSILSWLEPCRIRILHSYTIGVINEVLKSTYSCEAWYGIHLKTRQYKRVAYIAAKNQGIHRVHGLHCAHQSTFVGYFSTRTKNSLDKWVQKRNRLLGVHADKSVHGGRPGALRKAVGPLQNGISVTRLGDLEPIGLQIELTGSFFKFRRFRKRTSSIFGNPATQYLATPQSLN